MTKVRKTILLPADLARDAEATARTEGRTFSSVIEDALRRACIERKRQELRVMQDYWSSKAPTKACLPRLAVQHFLAYGNLPSLRCGTLPLNDCLHKISYAPGDLGVGGLVQPPPAARTQRVYPAGRSGGKPLSATCRGRHRRGVNLNQTASTKPGALRSPVGGTRRYCCLRVREPHGRHVAGFVRSPADAIPYFF